MTGNPKGSIWTSTAAIVTAIGTLLAGLAAVVTLMVPRVIDFIDPPSGPPAGNSNGGQAADETELSRDTFSARDTETLELDGAKAVRNPGADKDVTMFWGIGSIMAGEGIVEWTGEGLPTRAQCVERLRTHSTYSVDLENESVLCVRTSAGRTARLAVINTGAEIEVVVWKQKT